MKTGLWQEKTGKDALQNEKFCSASLFIGSLETINHQLGWWNEKAYSEKLLR